MKKKVNFSLQALEISSFRTDSANRIKGGTDSLNDPLTCTAFCNTGPSCPECAYTIYDTCEGGGTGPGA